MNDRVTDAMRRLGKPMVHCDWCRVTMRQPDDPFAGPHVVVIATDHHEERQYYVCSRRCRDRIKEQWKELLDGNRPAQDLSRRLRHVLRADARLLRAR